MRKALLSGIIIAAVSMGTAVTANAQHSGDMAVGRSAAGQLEFKPYDETTPCFDPATDVGQLDYIELLNSYRAVDPGFDANFASDPNVDFYSLESGAEIWLVAVEDMEPAFHVEYSGVQIVYAGDDLALGSSYLHRHLRFIVDANDTAFDPLRTLWYGTFVLEDRGSTGYTASAPFTLRFSIVECLAGDVNDDGAVNFFDIDPFVVVLTSGGDERTRCAADCNRDGYVDFFDIDAFVVALAG